MKIEINKKNYNKIQNEIYEAQSRRTEKKIRADFILEFKESVKKLFRKCGRKITDYNGAKINFEPRFKFKYERKFKGTAFDIEIINGKFYLVDVYITRCHSRLQTGIIELNAGTGTVDSFSDGYRGNYIDVVGNVLTFRLKDEEIIFDYKWNEYSEFDEILDGCSKNMPICRVDSIKRRAREFFVNEFPVKVRKQKLKANLRMVNNAA